MTVNELHSRGLQLINTGELEKAQEINIKILDIQHRNINALNQLGIINARLNNEEKGIKFLSKTIKLEPLKVSLLINQANVYYEYKKYENSINDIERVILIDPNNGVAYFILGNCYKAIGKVNQAIINYDKCIKIYPNHFPCLNNKGVVLIELEKYEEAIDCFNQSLNYNSQNIDAYSNMGNALVKLHKFELAIQYYSKAIEINPEYAEAYNNRGISYKEIKKLKLAILDLDKAVLFNKKYSEAYSNRGLILEYQKNIKEALNSYDKAVELESNNLEAYWNKSLLLLLNGQYDEGWKLYEYRWDYEKTGLKRPNFRIPLLLGHRNIEGKHILLQCEQGLGDTIQFIRFAKLLKEKGAVITLESPKELISILKNIEWIDNVILVNSDIQNYDYFCPLMSLLLYLEINLTNIPLSNKYIIADSKKIAELKSRLIDKKRKKIGLVWSGGFRKDQPELWTTNNGRNIPFKILEKFNNLSFDFISIQKGEPTESELQLTLEDSWKGPKINNYSEHLNDFSDTAALIENLDLVISVDTSTAHLSAALGKPTWILNRYDTCWRWLLDKKNSPWYESIKIYRQGSDWIWEEVLNDVINDLKIEYGIYK